MSTLRDHHNLALRRTSVSIVRPCPHCGAPATMTIIGPPGADPARADVAVLFGCPRHCQPSEHSILRLAAEITRR